MTDNEKVRALLKRYARDSTSEGRARLQLAIDLGISLRTVDRYLAEQSRPRLIAIGERLNELYEKTSEDSASES